MLLRPRRLGDVRPVDARQRPDRGAGRPADDRDQRLPARLLAGSSRAGGAGVAGPSTPTGRRDRTIGSATTTASLSDELWGSIADIYDRVLVHPFLHGPDRTARCPRSRSATTSSRTRSYLREYARRAQHRRRQGRPEPEHMHALQQDRRRDLVHAEQTFHDGLLPGVGCCPTRTSWSTPARADEPSPTRRTCSPPPTRGTFAEAVGAVLPCAWIYLEVGKVLSRDGLAEPALPALDRHVRRRGVRAARARP